MKLNTQGPAVRIAPAAEQRIRHWVDLARGEVSGLGTVVRLDDDNLLIEEVFLVEQICTGSHTELEDEAVAALLVELDAQGIDTGKVRFWWHSHGTMPTFWSNTDESCIAGLANDAFIVSMVSNKRAQDLVRVDLFHPFAATFDGVPLQVHHEDLGLHDECEAEFHEKVEEIVLLSRRSRRGGRQGDNMAAGPFADPPWPHGEDDDMPCDPHGDWWDDDGWALTDDPHQLDLQVDDPWNACLALEAYR